MIFEEEYESYAWNIRRLLNDVFQDRWISRAGPFAWPPHSLVLTPMDCFVCGQVKTNVWWSKPLSSNDLKSGSQIHFI